MNLVFLLSLTLTQAWASYNLGCMKLLVHPRTASVESYYRSMIERVQRHYPQLKDRTGLGPVDYEAIYDLASDMPFVATFSDGSEMRLGHDSRSLNALLEKLKTENAIQVVYLPLALAKLRFVLRESCHYLGLRGCESYDDYMGLMDNRIRVFSRREEQAIKWATIYQQPSIFTAASLKARSPEEAREREQNMRQRRLELSRKILSGVFNQAFAVDIYERFAERYINEAFDRLVSIRDAQNVLVLAR